jgi:hypothetical protein
VALHGLASGPQIFFGNFLARGQKYLRSTGLNDLRMQLDCQSIVLRKNFSFNIVIK